MVLIMNKPSVLLKVIGIFLIIYASIVLLVGVLSALGSGLSYAFGMDGLAGSVAIILLMLAIRAIVTGLLLFLCGVFGMKAKHLKACLIMAFVILTIEIIIFVVMIIANNGFTEGIINPLGFTSLICITLIILYIIGVRQTKTQTAVVVQPPPTIQNPE